MFDSREPQFCSYLLNFSYFVHIDIWIQLAQVLFYYVMILHRGVKVLALGTSLPSMIFSSKYTLPFFYVATGLLLSRTYVIY
jgi:hypothetical protein